MHYYMPDGIKVSPNQRRGGVHQYPWDVGLEGGRDAHGPGIVRLLELL